MDREHPTPTLSSKKKVLGQGILYSYREKKYPKPFLLYIGETTVIADAQRGQKNHRVWNLLCGSTTNNHLHL